jgi:hypothetical protein
MDPHILEYIIHFFRPKILDTLVESYWFSTVWEWIFLFILLILVKKKDWISHNHIIFSHFFFSPYFGLNHEYSLEIPRFIVVRYGYTAKLF